VRNTKLCICLRAVGGVLLLCKFDAASQLRKFEIGREIQILQKRMGAQQSYYYPSSIADQTGKVVLITGANVGLGLAAAEHFVRHNAHVILACRSVENGRKAKEHLVNIFPLYGDRIAVEQLDLSDLASVLACANRVKQQQKQLNALVNNAAVIPATRQLSKQGFEMQFAVQHLGHFVLTRELLPLLKATPGSRLCVVSSSVHKWVKQPLNFDEIVYRQNSYSQTAYPESKLMK
jgi:protochlorophyllide reductase